MPHGSMLIPVDVTAVLLVRSNAVQILPRVAADVPPTLAWERILVLQNVRTQRQMSRQGRIGQSLQQELAPGLARRSIVERDIK